MDLDTHHAVKALAELERRTVAQWLRLVVEDSVMSELTSKGTTIPAAAVMELDQLVALLKSKGK